MFVLIVATASAQVLVSDAEARLRAADLGLQRVYLDQNHYAYQLPADLDTPAFLTEGALEWRYDGQQEFSDPPEMTENRVYTMREPDYVLTGLDFDPNAYLGVGVAVRLDKYGRRWVLDHVDLEEARSRLEAYDDEVAAMFPLGEPDVAHNEGIEYNPDAGAEYTGIPTSWDYTAVTAQVDSVSIRHA